MSGSLGLDAFCALLPHSFYAHDKDDTLSKPEIYAALSEEMVIRELCRTGCGGTSAIGNNGM
jgi:hypothetical protein